MTFNIVPATASANWRIKHGYYLPDSPKYYAYAVWKEMMRRCTNPKHEYFYRYGGRGIKVCNAWLDFETFYVDVWPRPFGMTLDRINNDGNYEPQNVHWTSRKNQARNRGSSRLVFYAGRTITVAELAELAGLKYSTVFNRIHKGWSVDDAVREVGYVRT